MRETNKKYKTYDIIYCTNEGTARDMYKFYTEKGYVVGGSKVQISTGTHGLQSVEKLDILEELSAEEYIIADKEDLEFEKEMDEIFNNRNQEIKE